MQIQIKQSATSPNRFPNANQRGFPKFSEVSKLICLFKTPVSKKNEKFVFSGNKATSKIMSPMTPKTKISMTKTTIVNKVISPVNKTFKKQMTISIDNYKRKINCLTYFSHLESKTNLINFTSFKINDSNTNKTNVNKNKSNINLTCYANSTNKEHKNTTTKILNTTVQNKFITLKSSLLTPLKKLIPSSIINSSITKYKTLQTSNSDSKKMCLANSLKPSITNTAISKNIPEWKMSKPTNIFNFTGTTTKKKLSSTKQSVCGKSKTLSDKDIFSREKKTYIKGHVPLNLKLSKKIKEKSPNANDTFTIAIEQNTKMNEDSGVMTQYLNTDDNLPVAKINKEIKHSKKFNFKSANLSRSILNENLSLDNKSGITYMGKNKEDKRYIKTSIINSEPNIILKKNKNKANLLTLSTSNNKDLECPPFLNTIEVQEECNIDDEEGNYIIRIGDHINFKYEIISELGKGSFGQALKCYDHQTNEKVCIKIIKNKKKFNKQARIEIQLLNYIKENDNFENKKEQLNIVKMLDHFVFRGHICIVFELLDLNLYELIKKLDFRGLEMPLIKKYSVQILNALIFLQNHGIIHCDLKPENILLKQSRLTDVKVIDFGSSCFEEEKLYTYIQSRFYRAPEIILGLTYGVEIDMWSFGCILAELFTGVPIFPGENEKDLLDHIMEYLGIPPIEILKQSNKFSQFFDDDLTPIQIPNSRGKIRAPNTKRISKFLKGSDDNFIDFIKKCLEWDPSKRLKPNEALLHPWINAAVSKEVMPHRKQHRSTKDTGNLSATEGVNKKFKLNYPLSPKESSGKINEYKSDKIKNFKTISVEKKKKNNQIMSLSTNENIPVKTYFNRYKAEANRYPLLKAKINLTLDININLKKGKNLISANKFTNKSIQKISF